MKVACVKENESLNDQVKLWFLLSVRDSLVRLTLELRNSTKQTTLLPDMADHHPVPSDFAQNISWRKEKFNTFFSLIGPEYLGLFSSANLHHRHAWFSSLQRLNYTLDFPGSLAYRECIMGFLRNFFRRFPLISPNPIYLVVVSETHF